MDGCVESGVAPATAGLPPHSQMAFGVKAARNRGGRAPGICRELKVACFPAGVIIKVELI
jgi:hypothetical protein